jgi:hypothetical protein
MCKAQMTPTGCVQLPAEELCRWCYCLRGSKLCLRCMSQSIIIAAKVIHHTLATDRQTDRQMETEKNRSTLGTNRTDRQAVSR